ncbi:MAG: 6-carboxytetrahydropterin synthase [Lentimicrobiaceae bacterium]|nr:6-carboxytetrahydropterin synthase [Lentimicrobiaceae bacterium]
MVYITRKEHFNAAHRLFRPDFSDEKNLEVYGKCSNPNWHGHNYVLYVTVKGRVNPETGFVVNLKELSKVIKEKVIEKVDHKNMNLEVDFMKGRMASAEIMTMVIWEQLEQPVLLMGAELHCVKLMETENNIAEYYGG